MPFASQSQLRPPTSPMPYLHWLGALILVGYAGCSAQDFAYLSQESAVEDAGGRGASNLAAGTSDTAGRADDSATLGGGAGNGGTVSTSEGGVSGSTDEATGGSSACPPYTGTGGQVLTPPTNGFETTKLGWTTTAGSSLSRLDTGSPACEGSWFAACEGASRTGGWDGLGMSLLPYVEPGHRYTVTLAARFAPKDPPSDPTSLILSVAKACSDTSIPESFTRLQQQIGSTSWQRFTGQLEGALPGCPSLTRLFVYVETEDAGAALSIHADDFQLIDITAPSVAAAGGAGGGTAATAGSAGADTTPWVGTWATAPQLTEPQNAPPLPGLADNTLRQILHVTTGGEQLRMRFSNEFTSGPVTMNAVHLAVSTGGGAIEPSSDTALTFSGAASVTIPAGQLAFSDPFDFALAPLDDVAVSIHFGSVPAGITGHPGSRTTSYLQLGDAVALERLQAPIATEHWYYATGIDVVAPGTGAAVVVLGDSITDGRGSTTNGNDRWPDALARRLQANPLTAQVAVLNQGIGGNAVVSGGLGPSALERFDRDVLNQSGVRWLVVLEGVNDIAWNNSPQVADDLISAYQQFITKAHARQIQIYGVPILPFGDSSYDSPEHEAARQLVNDWIRTSGQFDAVLDLDEAVRDPTAPNKLLQAYDSGDHLHLSPTGYQAMAEAVDLSLFEL